MPRATRSTVFLTADCRNALRIDGDHIAKDERGRSVVSMSERINHSAIAHEIFVSENMPELSADEWILVMRTFQNAKVQPQSASGIWTELLKTDQSLGVKVRGMTVSQRLAIAECVSRFQSLDPKISIASRLSLAGCSS